MNHCQYVFGMVRICLVVEEGFEVSSQVAAKGELYLPESLSGSPLGAISRLDKAFHYHRP